MGTHRTPYEDPPLVDGGPGDLVNADEGPVLEHQFGPGQIVAGPPVDVVNHHAGPPPVLTNVTLAREPDGARAISVGPMRFTAAEAARLAIDLTEASDQIGEVRRKCGYEQ